MIKTRDEELAETPPQKASRESWPEGVRPIGIDELDNLGVDARGGIYWHGKLFKVEKRLSLSSWQKMGAIIVTVSAFFASIATVVQGWVMYHEWACKTGAWALSCP